MPCEWIWMPLGTHASSYCAHLLHDLHTGTLMVVGGRGQHPQRAVIVVYPCDGKWLAGL